jgi:hypothetical protein
MTRRLLLLAACAAPLFAADAEQQAYDLVTDAATHLSAGNADSFLALFDRAMPGYDEFAARIAALLQQAEVQSSVVVLRNQGDESVRALELDWFLQVRSRHETESIVRRREPVKCTVRKSGRKWKFFSLSPQSLFAPLKP